MPNFGVQCPYCGTFVSIGAGSNKFCNTCDSFIQIDKNGNIIKTRPSSKAKKEYGA